MKHPRTLAFARYALLVATLACGTATAQPRYGMSDDAYDVFARWMTSTCVGDEAERFADALRRHRAVLAPAFQRAMADGPPDELVQRARSAADARYAAIAAAPAAQIRIEGLTVRSVARPVRQRYVDGEGERYVAGYRSNAIAGLAIVGGPDSRAALRRIAGQPRNPSAVAAAEALKTMPVR